MSTQPKALLLADCLDGNAKTPWKREEAAAELRRLHTQRDELLAANAGLMQAARQALEALSELAEWESEGDPRHPASAAITALREALEAAPEPAAAEQEPVAHLYCGGQFGNELDEWEIDPEQYQCDKLNERFGALGKKARIPLYTAPQPARQPLIALPDGDIVFFSDRGDAVTGYSAQRVWEILRAHGIGGEA